MNESDFLSLLLNSGIATWVTVGAMFLLSIGVWAILIRKWASNRRQLASFAAWEKDLGVSPSLQNFAKLAKTRGDTPMGRVTRVALREIEGMSQFVSYDSLNARGQLVNESIERSVDAEKDANERGMTYLAFCTATGPLIGLFGTVWGIMNTFIAIGHQGSADIAVVAPGIGEALMAVLAGLIVAIPASLGYNAFAGFNRRAESALYNFGSEIVSSFKRGDLLALERAARESGAQG
ncbi:MAG: MotA/TolQ/ExbB proton channel [Fibrobacteria bacterium]|jgi:biopolymer transport protein TolQ|nr:MotA/TolQ/ExbB proton channel [Fibrobacteria bacterium]